MATKCFCDRCGESIEGSFGKKSIKIKKHRELYGQEWDEYRTYDLCANCLNQVERFIREE